MNIEDELRGALDVTAPPATTSLDTVLRRGKRRVFARRAGAVFGAAAVVVGIGMGAVTLTPPPSSQPPAAQLPRVISQHDLDWTRVGVPPQQPNDKGECQYKGRTTQPEFPVGMAELSSELVGGFEADLRRLFPGLEVDRTGVRDGNYRSERQFDLTDRGGTGSVQLLAGRFTTGSPQFYADDALRITGDCAPPLRKVLADGTILQMHGVHRFRPDKPFKAYAQALYAYRKDGLILKIEVRTTGSADMRRVPELSDFWEPVAPGRDSLPLSQEQLVMLGLAVAVAV
ncbi:hypothetical protein LFM09_24580 [Lentzea alba]|uniref:hypothetical protein n=1 Tax=Lentzea alba TaxID=2714351 RepID=UPI0039BF3F05